MPNFHTVTSTDLSGSGKSYPISRKLRSTPVTPALAAPSIDTPLLCRENPATYKRCGRTGRIYSQHRSMEDLRPHPEGFYVEWPAESEEFREIHAPTLAALAGFHAVPGQVYTAADCARLIHAMPHVPVPMLLHAARPRPAR